jgi:hypothetical protein
LSARTAGRQKDRKRDYAEVANRYSVTSHGTSPY